MKRQENWTVFTRGAYEVFLVMAHQTIIGQSLNKAFTKEYSKVYEKIGKESIK
jgi:hypothetical protein